MQTGEEPFVHDTEIMNKNPIRQKKLWKYRSVQKYLSYSETIIQSAISGGFEMAVTAGPLMGEEVIGAICIVDELEVSDERAVGFLFKLLEED